MEPPLWERCSNPGRFCDDIFRTYWGKLCLILGADLRCVCLTINVIVDGEGEDEERVGIKDNRIKKELESTGVKPDARSWLWQLTC